MTSSIKFGIQIEPQFGFKYNNIKEIALQGEKLEFTSIWSSDHFFYGPNPEVTDCLEAWTLLSALAVDTSTIRLGTLVTGNNYRYPPLLAKMTATVDQISGGRLDFGLGAGWKQNEYEAYGIPFPSVKDRMDQLEEAIQIIKKLWTEPKVTFQGKHYQLKDAYSSPKPV
ncbi:MAG: Pyrimidine monooxygenase RutA [Candidatus Heimdallarchaeota archaeon LC_2]|nr:MAG: Pyrimidine monooxygenase RutA [Candidatus Heimdallarchaeota archaeon LC_2]